MMEQAGQVMSGVGVSQRTRGRIEDGIEAGHEHLGGYVRVQRVVDPCQYLARIRKTVIPVALRWLPVGGTPNQSPRWVPLTLQRNTTGSSRLAPWRCNPEMPRNTS